MSFAIEVASEAVVISYRYPVSSLQLNVIGEGEVVAGKTAFGDFTEYPNLCLPQFSYRYLPKLSYHGIP